MSIVTGLSGMISRLGLLNKPAQASPQAGVDMSALSDLSGSDQGLMNMYYQQMSAQNQGLENLYGTPTTDALAQNQYAPNTAAGINVGTYGGNTFKAPIFASTAVLPLARFDSMMQNQKAQEIERKKEAMAASQGFFKEIKPDEISDPLYQQQFNDVFYQGHEKFVQEYMKAFPNNWQQMLENSPEYNRWLNNMSVMARSSNNLIDEIAQTETAFKNGEIVLSKEGQKALEELRTGVFEFGNDPMSNRVNILAQRNKIQSEKALSQIVEDSGIIDKAKALIEDHVYQLGRSDLGKLNFEVHNIESFENFADQMTEDLFRGQLSGSKIYSKKQVKDFILSYLGGKVQTEFKSVETGEMNQYQRGALALDRERVNLQKEQFELEKKKIEQSGTALDPNVRLRMEAVLAAKHGTPQTGGAGGATASGNFDSEEYVYVPTDIPKVDDITDEKLVELNNKYKGIILGSSPEDFVSKFKKVAGQTFIVGTKKDGKKISLSTSDPDFPKKYNGWLNSNDPTKFKISDDEFGKMWDEVYNKKTSSGGSGVNWQ